MKNCLVYTFRTFPYIESLNLRFGFVFVLDKLKQDINFLCEKIQKKKPKMILNIAKSTNKYSTIEKITINNFHGKGEVVKNANDKLKLSILNNLIQNGFKVREKPAYSFCNYSMFKVAWF